MLVRLTLIPIYSRTIYGQNTSQLFSLMGNVGTLPRYAVKASFRLARCFGVIWFIPGCIAIFSIASFIEVARGYDTRVEKRPGTVADSHPARYPW